MLIAEKIRAQMIILEILEHIEDADLEDWLTAAFIENEHQLPLKELCTNDGYPSPSGVVDIWMVEITSREGKVWIGKFNVDFFEEFKNGPETGRSAEHQSGEILFTLDTKTAEVTFKTDARTLDRQNDPGPELVAP